MRGDPRALLLIISKKRIDDERPPSFPVRRQFLSFPPGPAPSCPVPFRLVDRAKPARYAAGKKLRPAFLRHFLRHLLRHEHVGTMQLKPASEKQSTPSGPPTIRSY